MKDKIYYRDGTVFEGVQGVVSDGHWQKYPPHYSDRSKIIHRDGGPAIEYASGTRGWYQNGKLHREDGPAIDVVGGAKFWYLDDILYSKKEYINLLKEVDSLGPILGLTDLREWVRNRWRKKLNES